MPFKNPIAGGDGSLILPALKSPNYTPGPPAVGWAIKKDGSAQFADIALIDPNSSGSDSLVKLVQSQSIRTLYSPRYLLAAANTTTVFQSLDTANFTDTTVSLLSYPNLASGQVVRYVVTLTLDVMSTAAGGGSFVAELLLNGVQVGQIGNPTVIPEMIFKAQTSGDRATLTRTWINDVPMPGNGSKKTWTVQVKHTGTVPYTVNSVHSMLMVQDAFFL